MEDDKNSLIEFTKKFDFNKHQTLESDFYPNTIHHIFGRNALSLLELCCYHGSINCFNFLTTELKLEITQGCVSYSFLSGNKEIIDKCLAEKDPNFVTMEYAVISRNIDYVNLLMDEHDLFPDYEGAAYYNNLQAFIIGLKKCRYINDYFFHSLYFGFEPVYEIILSLGANINAVKIKNNVPLIHWCAIYNNVEFA
ncbi:hypothetical protein TVAG_244870 [Trichomonas vaginalis G3]|uniref:DUF3447 domain-containing protein n=1 Tax=Trichomonas vaginalis (strain ATCC PRA-98 / G3) TaxID=412133 RepID=A2EMQ9_TRIV3|nr:proteasome regulatory particle assembly [Trichomonas vaginalis G3]EAY06055.1 hypothetical protein TVAG_244870 [Trichomonas vaginalis G3]KAI5536569.1 proteasome regulatory particle assembly [Trichomonas vaginalis G3]|eukprot:XP_001318278.1 hypothetical protein [Trichomonas vaginalis G3]